ncbi:MAG: flagellar biosynthesis protein FlhF [Planctomycetes bacterium]|nr:flagellar biosynthesis protein FlhF [Planctomycetota bacterium]
MTDIRTYRAGSLQEALALVRRDLGPTAAVLHTREVRGGLLRWLTGRRDVEIVASSGIRVPSRWSGSASPTRAPHSTGTADRQGTAPTRNRGETLPRAAPSAEPARVREPEREAVRDGGDLRRQVDQLRTLVDSLCRQSSRSSQPDMPETLFRLFTDLLDADVSEELARELVERMRSGASPDDLRDGLLLKARLTRMVEEEIGTREPILVTPGRRRVVALVGPTGVGKTTTIAKLAANFHLREHRRVGLITVDTYRIAAVEQLRTYAEIIDLPMEVVATPREMRIALDRLADLDLVLMDTAGRSPRDDVKIQELKSMLAESRADEVHLVLSAVSSVSSLKTTAGKFVEVGANALVLTKLDEAAGLGNLLPLLRTCRLPLSYLTHGQNVPDDIQGADRRALARAVLGMEAIG